LSASETNSDSKKKKIKEFSAVKISILRHGRSETLFDSPISACEFTTWINHYNQSGVSRTTMPSSQSLDCANSCRVIVSSGLARSIQSAALLLNDQTLFSDNLFDEAGMPYAEWKSIKLRPRYWAVLFRFMWYLGYAKNAESRVDTKQRAKRAALQLEELAHENQSVLFVGHGIFNRLLAAELLSLGWSGPRNPGAKHWAFGDYSK